MANQVHDRTPNWRGAFLMCFLCCWSLFAFADQPSFQTIRWESWQPPVVHGILPFLFENRIYLFDDAEDVIKVYEGSPGFESPKLLWKSAGRGQAPGEIPRGRIHHLAVDSETDDLWVSHQTGFIVFDSEGREIFREKVASNQARIAPFKGILAHTAMSQFQLPDIFYFSDLSAHQALLKIPRPNGLPLNKNSAYITPESEVVYTQGLFFYYDMSVGDFLAIDSAGDVKVRSQVKQVPLELLTPVLFKARFEGDRVRTVATVNPHSGMVRRGETALVFSRNACAGVETEDGQDYQAKVHWQGQDLQTVRILCEVSLKTGETERRLFHPLGLRPVFLLGLRDDSLYLFDLESANEIYILPFSALKTIKSLRF